MTSEGQSKKISLYLLLGTLLVIALALSITFVVENRNEHRLTAELERTQMELQSLGEQIRSIKDADLASMNAYIAAYAQIESLQNAYDQKLQRFVELYNLARDKDSHRGLIDIRNLEGSHHPETWENMSKIITLVRQINEITKREGQVIHAMASLPESERVRYWHEEFVPLAAQEQVLREKLPIAGQNMSPKATSSKCKIRILLTFTVGSRHLRFRPRCLQLDVTNVMVITSHRNDSTQQGGCMAVTDLYAPHEAREQARGGLAKAAALWNRAARQLGISLAEFAQ